MADVGTYSMQSVWSLEANLSSMFSKKLLTAVNVLSNYERKVIKKKNRKQKLVLSHRARERVFKTFTKDIECMKSGKKTGQSGNIL